MKKYRLIIVLLGLFLCFVNSAMAEEASFIVQKIQVKGLHYINFKTFLHYLPVKEGDRVSSADTSKILANLYKSGFFADVGLFRSGNDLIVSVVERPVISAIKINGNKKITNQQMQEILSKSGFREGQVFDDSILTGIRNSLLRQYYDLGYYSVQINTDTVIQDQKFIVNLKIVEGPLAKIKDIQIIGNEVFKTRTLLSNFALSKSSLITMFTSSDLYSREKLDADLDGLKAFYYDRGYLQFKVNSTQVQISPDRKGIYIKVYITEGPIYTISDIKLTGDLLGYDIQLQNFINIKKGEVFSRQKIIDVDGKITRFMADKGYAFANVDPETKLDIENKAVALNFVLRPGKLVYVNKISFAGNIKTADYVLRREMRQMEGGLFSLTNVDESRRRLANLGYIKDIDTKLMPVTDVPDQVDLLYNIVEDSSATASLNMGYSDADHFIAGGGISERNLFGTGKAVGAQITVSKYSQLYGINYYDPYITENNISMGVNLFAQVVNQGEQDHISEYSTNITGGTLNFGFPILEHNRLNFGGSYNHTRIKLDDLLSAQEMKDFVAEYGEIFDLVKFYTSLDYSNLDRAVFPTKGCTQSIGGLISVPVFKNSLEFYKLSYSASAYYPLGDYFVVTGHAFLGYGNGYSKNDSLPFFENYFAGGLGSVRGYQSNTLGPQDENFNSIGGNISTNATVGLVFPNFISDTIRTTVFFDVGNVYRTGSDLYGFDLKELRYSAGIQAEWHGFIPLVASIGIPLNKHDDVYDDKGNRIRAADRVEYFQFSIGTSI